MMLFARRELMLDREKIGALYFLYLALSKKTSRVGK
jgi:hypothetical protein